MPLPLYSAGRGKKKLRRMQCVSTLGRRGKGWMHPEGLHLLTWPFHPSPYLKAMKTLATKKSVTRIKMEVTTTARLAEEPTPSAPPRVLSPA